MTHEGMLLKYYYSSCRPKGYHISLTEKADKQYSFYVYRQITAVLFSFDKHSKYGLTTVCHQKRVSQMMIYCVPQTVCVRRRVFVKRCPSRIGCIHVYTNSHS